MSEAAAATVKRRASPRKPMRVKDARTRFIGVRCTAEEHATITEAAAKAGLSVGAYVRTLALGSPGPRAVRRPPIERRELARLLGWLGKLGSNVNQLAYGYNRERRLPGLPELMAVREDVAAMRAAMMKALGRDH